MCGQLDPWNACKLCIDLHGTGGMSDGSKMMKHKLIVRQDDLTVYVVLGCRCGSCGKEANGADDGSQARFVNVWGARRRIVLHCTGCSGTENRGRRHTMAKNTTM